ncbi:MAG: hypothetical protein GX481_03800 [Atopobium sp.]|jgi:hypothetical protein|nr:hypothetical protein [Atopobium sp.]
MDRAHLLLVGPGLGELSGLPILDDPVVEGLVVDPELCGALPDALFRVCLPGLPVVLDGFKALLLRIPPGRLRLFLYHVPDLVEGAGIYAP